jgi:hypothetical protein
MNSLTFLKQPRTALLRLQRILLLTLREIFDEAAYARYLQRTGAPESRKSYADFLAEKNRAKAPSARCC